MNEKSVNGSVKANWGKGIALGVFLGASFAAIGEDKIIGFVIGMSSGFVIGAGFWGGEASKQKRFSELTDEEKRTRIAVVALAAVLVVAGIVTAFLASK